ncbi:MAG: DUF2235 domain-containing protein [Phycisphaerales bacterium]|nr:DUF2235 domain-containing protein [Phycisphaerales bacterium]
MEIPVPKNIVVCCDGTWNRFERGKVTNIVRLCSCLVRHSASQVVYYDPGVPARSGSAGSPPSSCCRASGRRRGWRA